MSEKQINSEKSNFFKRILFLLLRQTVAALICLCIALGLKLSNHSFLNNCGKALNLAINHNPGWEETVKDAFYNLKNPPSEKEVK